MTKPESEQACPNCGEPGTHQRDEWGICLIAAAKEPVYIRSDFINAHVELTSEQVKKLIEFARQLEKEPTGPTCSCGESDVYDGYAVCEVHPDGN